MRAVERVCDALRPVSDSIRDECSPAHIAGASGPQVNIAAVWCLSKALGVDKALAEDFALGFRVCGQLPSSGQWSPDFSPPDVDLDLLIGDGWNAKLAASIEERAWVCSGIGRDPPQVAALVCRRASARTRE